MTCAPCRAHAHPLAPHNAGVERCACPCSGDLEGVAVAFVRRVPSPAEELARGR